MFKSVYSMQLTLYYELRRSSLSESAGKHELCYLKRFDEFISRNVVATGCLSEELIEQWISTVKGKSSSVENEVIVVRQFLKYLRLDGEMVYLPIIPKVREDYIPYIFSDKELSLIFDAADNLHLKDPKADPYLTIEIPVILRLLYCCGLRIGETVKIDMSDVDLENGILRLVNTKGNKHRVVPMASGMTEILTSYCLAMGLVGKDAGWLFPSHGQTDHISGSAIKRQFTAILRKNGIQSSNRKKHERGPCLHCFRHVFAFRSFAQSERAGRHLDDSIPYLSIYLGHDSLDETSKYLKFSSELFPESVEQFGEFMEDLLPEVDYEA